MSAIVANAVGSANGSVALQQVLPLDAIDVCPQIRGEFTDESVEPIRQSLRVHKRLYNPPVVESTDDPKRFRLLTGHRRLRALQLEGVKEAPFIVLPQTLVGAERVEAQHIENCVRLDINIWQRGLAYQELITGHGYSREMICSRLGVSPALISKALKVVERLDPSLRGHVESKALTTDEAWAIAAKVPKAEKQREVAAAIMGGAKLKDALKLGRKAKPPVKTHKLYAGDFTVTIAAKRADSDDVEEAIKALTTLIGQLKKVGEWGDA